MTCPCCVSAVTWTISMCGWAVSNRTASAPPYPDAPMTLALILFTDDLPLMSASSPSVQGRGEGLGCASDVWQGIIACSHLPGCSVVVRCVVRRDTIHGSNHYPYPPES